MFAGLMNEGIKLLLGRLSLTAPCGVSVRLRGRGHGLGLGQCLSQGSSHRWPWGVLGVSAQCFFFFSFEAPQKSNFCGFEALFHNGTVFFFKKKKPF